MHIPVLLKEVIQYLRPKPNADFIDASVGAGGHAAELLARTGPKGRLLGIDWDIKAIHLARQKLQIYGDRVSLEEGNFAQIDKFAQDIGFNKVWGILFDLGLGSFQIEDETLGLSFQKDAPLDMRISAKRPKTAADIVNHYPLPRLVKIFKEYADIQAAWQIARQIVQERGKNKITRTLQLAKIIERSAGFKKPGIHPATLVFQALRIEVNSEFQNLNKVLPAAAELLQKGGRVVVISFHSGEDRIVKNFFKQQSVLKIITAKPVTPSNEEIIRNPKSRSAKLRVAERR